MGFWSLFEVAIIPVLEVLLISLLGVLLASSYFNILVPEARKHINKVVFIVFTPSLIFASLAKSVTLKDIISWWFMPVNIGLIFLFGGILGWVAVKILKPEPYLEGLIIACCSAGNLGNLLVVVVPAICDEDGSPFGDTSTCTTNAYSYASFSMALGGFYIWTYTYYLMRTSGKLYQKMLIEEAAATIPNNDLDADAETHLLMAENEASHDEEAVSLPSTKSIDEARGNIPATVQTLSSGKLDNDEERSWEKIKRFLLQIFEELLSPPTVAAVLGFIFGATKWLRSLIIGDSAPLRVIQDSITLLGEGTIPSITLILGGNLTRGFSTGRIKPWDIIAVIIVRYVLLPAIGVGVVKGANKLGFLSSDLLYQYVLMVQFTLPPAMNVGTMAELFDVGKEECSVIFMYTYLVAALALTAWSTFYLWILS